MTGAGDRARGPSGVVTLLTDFGLDDAYVGTVKGVLLTINPRARLVDLTHAVPPQDVRRAALLLEAAWRFFPPGTVHLAVVDPGVGGPRRPIAVEAGGHYFVGPDNGLLGFCFDLPGRAGRGADRRRRYHRRPVSRTFHGRDVFAPVAAHCSRGVPLAAFGPALRDPVRLPAPAPARSGPRRRGGPAGGPLREPLTNLRGRDLPGPAPRGVLRIGGAGSAAWWGPTPSGRGRRSGPWSTARAGSRCSCGRAAPAGGSGWGRAPPSAGGAGAALTPRRRSTPGLLGGRGRGLEDARPSRSSSRRGSRPPRRSTSSRPPSPSSGPRRGSRSRTSRRP